MSLQRPKSDPDETKASLLPVDLENGRRDSVAITPKIEPVRKPDNIELNNGFLSAPFFGPVRPLSPDTISNLSIDEYEQIGPSHSNGVPRSSFDSPAPARGWRGKLHGFWVHNKGLAYMLVAQVFGTLMNVTTRLLEIEGNKGKGLHPFQILFARMGITFVLASTYMFWTRTPYFPFGRREIRWLLAVRGFSGFFGVFGMYYSLLYLPLADATVITFLAPSLACWACSILIKEPFTRVEQIAGLISLVGVILIARPTILFAALAGNNDSPPATGVGDAMPSRNGTAPPIGADASNYESVTPIQRLSAVGIALLGVLGSATTFTAIRWIGKQAHPLISVNYFAAMCTLVSIIMQSVLPGVGWLLPADLKDWGYLFFLGTCGFVMQFLLAAALAYEKSSRATNMTYTQMLFALGFDKLIFGHTPGIMSIMGSSLILSSAIVVAVQRDPNKEQKDIAQGSRMVNGNEESRTGLMSGVRDVESGEDHDRLPVQEVQLRALR